MSTRPRSRGPAGPTLAGMLFLVVQIHTNVMTDVCWGNTCPGAGALDLSFSADGKLVTDFFGSTDVALAVALQSDGKIVAAGVSRSTSTDFALARYNVDGSLDASFGLGGKAVTDFFGFSDAATGVAIQTDGKIVAAGRVSTTSTGIISSDFGLARYNIDGTLDASFGIGGKVTADLSGSVDFAEDVAIQTDGKIVAVGRAGAAGDIALARYNTDGTLDASFGTGGTVTTDFFGSADGAFAVALQSDGKIVAAGVSSSTDFALARYNVDGSLDASFGTGGKVSTDFASSLDLAGSVVIQSDGKLVVAGVAQFQPIPPGSRDFALARYNTDGSLDGSFGTGGKVTTDFGGNEGGNDVGLQADGRIVIAGFFLSSAAPFIQDFALARYNGDGSLDADFGTGGRVTTDFPGNDAGSALIIHPDGTILVAGNSNNDFALARYHALTACELIELLIADVQELVTTGALTQAGANGLIAKLEEAIKVLDKGHVRPGINKLRDFIDLVEAHVNSGKLSPAEAQPLIDAANSIVALLEGGAAKVIVSDERVTVPTRFTLAQNSPNPFNPQTTIRLALPSRTGYALSIYDVAGRLVRRYTGDAGPGEVSVVWDGRNGNGEAVASGVYLYEARAAGYAETKKMVLSK